MYISQMLTLYTYADIFFYCINIILMLFLDRDHIVTYVRTRKYNGVLCKGNQLDRYTITTIVSLSILFFYYITLLYNPESLALRGGTGIVYIACILCTITLLIVYSTRLLRIQSGISERLFCFFILTDLFSLLIALSFIDNLFIIWAGLESSVMCTAALSSLPSGESSSVETGFVYSTFNIVSSIFFSIGTIIIYFLFGTFNMISVISLGVLDFSLFRESYYLGYFFLIFAMLMKLATSIAGTSFISYETLHATLSFYVSTVHTFVYFVILLYITYKIGDISAVLIPFTLIGVISMLTGSVAGLQSIGYRRLAAASVLSNIGILLLLNLVSSDYIVTAFSYFTIYIFISTAMWIISVSCLSKRTSSILDYFEDWASAAHVDYIYPLLVIIFFLLLGIPPFSLFFLKYSLLLSAVLDGNLYAFIFLASAVLTSTVVNFTFFSTLFIFLAKDVNWSVAPSRTILWCIYTICAVLYVLYDSSSLEEFFSIIDAIKSYITRSSF